MQIIKVRHLEDYLLEVTFDNFQIKIVDLKPFVGRTGVFEPLEDIEYFKNVKLDQDKNAVYWKNGANIKADVLYEIGMEA